MNEVRAILLDPDGVYWPDSYLVSAYNIIVASIVGENPTALTKVVEFDCAEGVNQVLPDDAIQFLRCPSNVTGQSIRQVSAEALQEDDDNWYGAPKTSQVLHAITDEYDPLRFRVYPPNDGTGAVFLQYAYTPADVTSLTEAFVLSGGYRMMIRNGTLGMAYALNTERQDLPKSQAYLALLDKAVLARIQSSGALLARSGAPTTTE